MRIRSVVLSLAIAGFISGCAHHSTVITGQADPRYQPTKLDSYVLLLSKSASIRERQLLPVLRDEMCRRGMTVVDSFDAAKWAIGVSAGSETYAIGSTSSAFAVPVAGGAVMVGSSRNEIASQDYAHLYVFDAADAKDGDAMAIWEASVKAKPNVFRVYEPIIFRDVLDSIGSNFRRETRLDKEYLYSVRDGAGCN